MKKLLSIVLGVLLVGGSVFATQKRVRDANPFHVFQAVKITSNGALSGDCFFQAQNGVVSDCQGNNFLTGFTETDPIRSTTSGDYVPMSATGNWNSSYSWIQSYSGRALLWNVIGGTLSPIDNDIKFVVGSGATITNGDLAIGKNARAYGINSSAIGGGGIYGNTTANGDSSLAMVGGDTVGTGSISIGALANSNGTKSLSVFGNAIGDYAMALGAGSDAVDRSNAIGFNVNTYYTLSSALGYDLDCRGILCLGRYNLGLTGSVLEIGAGSATTGFNALTIHSSTSGYMAEFAGPIVINNGVNPPFRLAYSGGVMEGQYYTGGVWVSAVKYTLPR